MALPPASSPAQQAADYCAAALRSGSDPEALRLLAQASECLRRPELPLNEADVFARRLIEAHFQRIENLGSLASVDLSALWKRGLGAETFSLLLDFLQYCLVTDIPLERRLTLLRRRLLLEHSQKEIDTPLLQLASAIAVQAFRGEYVWALRDDEVAAIENLTADSSFSIALLAAYRPLQSAAADCDEFHFRELIRVQLTEPQAEAALRGKIPALTPIADPTSQAVRAQYEENPYPRWHRLPGGTPKAVPSTGASRPKKLIAGCGTGQHPVFTAAGDPGADYLAVDLSLTSLAYAMRKAGEYGVRNVEFRQADILALADCGLSFESISCVGVLHHLARPLEGLRALKQVLAGTSGLKVAVYTESGRQGVVAARRIREERGLPATAEGIRALRKIILELPEGHPARALLMSPDYYSVSGFRDLAFHVMEHRYTIPQFAALAGEAGMLIEQVQAPRTVAQRFHARFPGREDPENWAKFEAENPGVFGSMYRFMLAKRPA